MGLRRAAAPGAERRANCTQGEATLFRAAHFNTHQIKIQGASQRERGGKQDGAKQ